ncbi:hypothetical protein ABES08_21560 [Peribacillus simplex]|uniref:hypothetical protein n=1 Tax=Peribacillus simplex TaxID=1478 RepID=UPI003CE80D66
MEGYSHLGSLLLKHEVDGKIITDLDEMLSSLSTLARYHLHYHTGVGVGLCLGKLLFTTILSIPFVKISFSKKVNRSLIRLTGVISMVFGWVWLNAGYSPRDTGGMNSQVKNLRFFLLLKTINIPITLLSGLV